MKWLRLGISITAFTFQYIIPVLLFGRIVPYTRGELAAGLTTMGIIAACFLLLILMKKVKESVIRWDHSIKRGIILSLIEAVPVVLIALFLRWLAPTVSAILAYWYDVIPFFVIGRVFYCINEALYVKEKEGK